ncbi:MAG: DUF6175 family protein [Paludibacteraceae bacterium]|nr:DUF6175 family protein [Paludibacteraceae bacterium]
MKKTLLLFLFFTTTLLCIATTPSKKPTLMILPSDHWCEQRFYMTTWDNQGIKIKTPDYQTAFLQDRELTQVISKIGQLLTDRGYSLKDAEQETKAVFNRIAEEQVTTSKTSGSSIAETPLDMLKKRAKMDVLIQIDWTFNSNRSITFTLEAFDTYTSKRIATSTGTGKPSNQIIPIMLEESIKSKIKDFDKQIDKYYADIKKNGREIILTIKCWENWDGDLELENEEGDELLDVIQGWLRKNTVNGVFNLSDATENFAQFEQVRIPLRNEEDEAIDARMFATKLRKYLTKEYNFTSKVMTRGLGEAIIVIGEK